MTSNMIDSTRGRVRRHPARVDRDARHVVTGEADDDGDGGDGPGGRAGLHGELGSLGLTHQAQFRSPFFFLFLSFSISLILSLVIMA